MRTRMNNRAISIIVLLAACFSLSGCPRMAYVDIYNNTGLDVSISVGGRITQVPRNSSERVMFNTASMHIESELGKWVYGRTLIPYRGEDGPYFDGTAYVQLEADGLIYVLQKTGVRPETEFPDQPEGFPVGPGS
jgi:hypothetical protein